MKHGTRAQQHVTAPDRETIKACQTDVIDLIDHIGLQQRWWPHGLSWETYFVRYDPTRSFYCTLVYRTPQDGCTLAVVELGVRKSASTAETDQWHERLGSVRIQPFHSDPALPGVSQLLSLPDRVTVVRYRPRHRCTLRIELPGQPMRYAKVFSDHRGQAIHADAQRLWACSQRGELAFRVAEPLAWDTHTCTQWQLALPGNPIPQLLDGDQGESIAGAIGRALASLSASTVEPSKRFDHAAVMLRSQRHLDELAQRLPAQLSAIVELRQAIRQRMASQSNGALHPIHGALHPSQWLLHGSTLSLVDLDRFSLGDPEFDVAVFISDLELRYSSKAGINALVDAFRAGYEAVHGPLDAALLATYRALDKLPKAVRAIRSLSAEAETKSVRNIGLALDGISESGGM